MTDQFQQVTACMQEGLVVIDNVDGGAVRITVEPGVLTVSDTGTGLGLSIVKHAVQYHNAKMELESTPEIGTTIKVRF